ncbi:MAG: deoxyhypusine synthase family protein [Candidatus Thorarchaeota archaeon]
MNNKISIDQLIKEYINFGFTAGSFGKACEIIKDMVKDPDTSIFLSLSGALIPAGQQKYLVDILKSGKISGIVSTGATLTHDYLENLGFQHSHVDHTKTDAQLRESGINRILDMAALNEGFEAMEEKIHEFLESKYHPTSSDPVFISIPTFLHDLGNTCSSNSVLGICAKSSIPIFCPAITDSMLGVHIMTYREFHPKFFLDTLKELKEFTSLCFDSKKTSAIVFGGGVPKNYLFQGMLFSGKELHSAIQFTMDRPEHGGLSGASLDEAISWGKIRPDASFTTVVVDVTLILPIISKLFY